MLYSIHLLDDNGKGVYLSIKGKSKWKTKRIAIKHLKDIQSLISKGKFDNYIIAELENEYGELIKVKGV